MKMITTENETENDRDHLVGQARENRGVGSARKRHYFEQYKGRKGTWSLGMSSQMHLLLYYPYQVRCCPRLCDHYAGGGQGNQKGTRDSRGGSLV